MYKDWLNWGMKDPKSLLTIQAVPKPWIIAIFDPQISRITMLKQVSRSFVPLVLILWALNGIHLKGQGQNLRVQELKEASNREFDEGSYRNALSGFRKLLAHDQKDIQSAYYAGRCLVELNEELAEAIELLYGASRQDVQADAMFYLGRAYHLNYNFKEARSCYESYERTASKQDRRAKRVKHLIASCQTAMDITATYNPYEVMNVTFMDLSDSLQYGQVKMKGGNLARKPGAYFHNDEERDGLTALMFRPKDPVRGDYVYFSGYGKSKKNGAQIFRVRKGNGNSWSEPKEVSFLNGPGDEILPYFDPIENDLYFASDSWPGVGGFDLYKSHYDEDRDAWTEPLNLGFPVNSVADEFLLLPGSDLGMVLFFSNRQGPDTLVTVYRVHLAEPKKNTTENDYQQLRQIALFGGVAQEMLAESRAIIEKNDTGEVLQPAKPEQDVVPYPVYQESLALALRHQAVSDSLKDLATKARIRVRESDDPNDRWVWQKQILVWEKKAKDEEERADELYVQVEQRRKVQSAGPAVHPPEVLEVDRQIGDLTVYRYKTGQDNRSASTKGPKSPSKLKRFEILGHSPYSKSHPIPMDEAIPAGTYYRIQLGAFGMEVSPSSFGGISPLSGQVLEERGLVKYYAGEFSRYDDASSALPRIHTLGYEDAFIVAWYNGIQVSTQRAKQLE
jgi:hypothetical protein